MHICWYLIRTKCIVILCNFLYTTCVNVTQNDFKSIVQRYKACCLEHNIIFTVQTFLFLPAIQDAGHTVTNECYFDTIKIKVNNIETIKKRAQEKEINLQYCDGNHVCIIFNGIMLSYLIHKNLNKEKK